MGLSLVGLQKEKKWVPTFSCAKFGEQFKYISFLFAVQRADGGLNIFTMFVWDGAQTHRNVSHPVRQHCAVI